MLFLAKANFIWIKFRSWAKATTLFNWTIFKSQNLKFCSGFSEIFILNFYEARRGWIYILFG